MEGFRYWRKAVRILLVEDDPMIGEAIQGALDDASYAADWVKDGLLALTALDAQHYDLVLLDLGLPGKDGQAVLGSIRAQSNAVPLLIITARDSLDDRLRGLDGGADDYLLKPFDMTELLARIRAVLRRKGGSGMPLLGNGVVTLDPSSVAVLFDRQQMTLQYSNNAAIEGDDEESRVIIQHLTDGAKAIHDDDASIPLALPTTLPDGFLTLDVGGEPFRVLVRTTSRGERIAVAQETGIRDRDARESAQRSLLPFLILFPVLLIVVGDLVRKLFRPIALL